MKKSMSALLMIIVMISITLLSGCSSNNQKSDIRQARGSYSIEANKQLGTERANNLTEEERQKLFEERQQQMIEACEGKNDGDACQFQVRMGESDGICKIMDENLVCTTDRPMRQR